MLLIHGGQVGETQDLHGWVQFESGGSDGMADAAIVVLGRGVNWPCSSFLSPYVFCSIMPELTRRGISVK